LLNSKQNPEVSDTTGDDSSTKAGQTIPNIRLKTFTFAHLKKEEVST